MTRIILKSTVITLAFFAGRSTAPAQTSETFIPIIYECDAPIPARKTATRNQVIEHIENWGGFDMTPAELKRLKVEDLL